MLLEPRNPSGYKKGEEDNQGSTSTVELSSVVSELIPQGIHTSLINAAAGGGG